MNCPRCVREIPYASLTCGECGFSLFDQDAQFGSDAVTLSRVTNTANSFSQEQIQEIEKALDGFEKNFPQLFLAVYAVALPVMASVRQFGFWLLNRAAVSSVDITRPNENGALLIIDETSGQAGLVVGYLLECYFPEPELAEILEAARKDWAAGNLADGVLEVVVAFTKAIQKKSKVAAKNPSKFTPKTETKPGKPEFHRVHEGQAAPAVEEESKSSEPATTKEK